jgi:hypothetical protein
MQPALILLLLVLAVACAVLYNTPVTLLWGGHCFRVLCSQQQLLCLRLTTSVGCAVGPCHPEHLLHHCTPLLLKVLSTSVRTCTGACLVCLLLCLLLEAAELHCQQLNAV